jgi:hypothetical protein
MKHFQRLPLALAIFALMAVSALAPGQDEEKVAAKDQALKLYNVFKSRDWKSLYDLIAFSPKVAPTVGDRDKFVEDFRKGLGDNNDAVQELMGNMSDVRTGAALVEGNHAYVPASSVVDFKGTKVRFLGLIKLVKVDSVWKWDLAFSDDVEKATAQRFTELLGAPEKD